jgi:hypothetical protein
MQILEGGPPSSDSPTLGPAGPPHPCRRRAEQRHERA